MKSTQETTEKIALILRQTTENYEKKALSHNDRLYIDLTKYASEMNCLKDFVRFVDEPFKGTPYNDIQIIKGLSYAFQMTETPSMYYDLITDWIYRLWSVRNKFMSNSEFKTLKQLPKKFKVYRGADSDGLSWTLSRETAEWFNNRNIRLGNQNSIVMEKWISKDDVYAYLGTRGEQEIILLQGKK